MTEPTVVTENQPTSTQTQPQNKPWQSNGEVNAAFFLPGLNKDPESKKPKKHDSGVSGDSHSEHSDSNVVSDTPSSSKRALDTSETVPLDIHGAKKIRIENTDESSEENINVDVVGSTDDDSDNRGSNAESNDMSSGSSLAHGLQQFHSLLANHTGMNTLQLPMNTARQRLFAQAEKQRRRANRKEKIKTRLDELMKQVRYLQREYQKVEGQSNSSSTSESESSDEQALNILNQISLPGFESTNLEKMIKKEMASVLDRVKAQLSISQTPQFKNEVNLSNLSNLSTSPDTMSPVESDGQQKSPQPVVTRSPTAAESLLKAQLQQQQQNLLQQTQQIQKLKQEAIPSPVVTPASLPTLPPVVSRHTSLHNTPVKTNQSTQFKPTPSTPSPTNTTTSPQRTLSLNVSPGNTNQATGAAAQNPTYYAALQAAQQKQQLQANLVAQQQQQAAAAQMASNNNANVAATQAYQQAYQKALLAAKLSQAQAAADTQNSLLRQPHAMLGVNRFGLDGIHDASQYSGGYDLSDIYGNIHKEGLTPHHLKKAKLMFFYNRYPSSSILKTFFTDVRFNRATTSQLIKWFSNFREFFYIHIEKTARQAVTEGMVNADDLKLSRDSELIRVLNNHYNKSNQFEVPLEFVQVAQQALKEFFNAIRDGKDQDPSWKKVIYKVICKLDSDVPARFKAPQLAELGD